MTSGLHFEDLALFVSRLCAHFKRLTSSWPLYRIWKGERKDDERQKNGNFGFRAKYATNYVHNVKVQSIKLRDLRAVK